ncbi:FGGY family of carbohydrate kinase [Popillia japonica]|uniref:FGGY family of carbohydrate kinase n=1 Tax=Popillia japonica TaxID=7064 RepID=A0AAW1K0Y7_POPJA
MTETTYIAALDIGTTTIKCYINNSRAETVGNATTNTKLLYPQPGYVEIDPDELWNTIIAVVKEAISCAGLEASSIHCLAITTQRGTFITWHKDTGQHLHNFITWKDIRSKELVEKWNNSYLLKSMQSGAYLIYLFNRKDRFLMGSRLKLSTIQCTSRLLWVLENIPEVRDAASKHNLCFGTIDTWLVHKLTGGRKFITEVSNASSTALFDPFVMDWSNVPTTIMKIPKHIFPQIVNSDHDFGKTIPEIFGAPIRIGSVIADQQASMFGSFCYQRKDLKITIGTGSFININTDSQPLASADGTYPLVGWTLKNISTYLTEASCKDAGSLIQWALNMGIATEVSKISAQAYSVKDSDGVFFIPAFSGLGAKIGYYHLKSIKMDSLLYANDIVLIADSHAKMKGLVRVWKEEIEKMGMIINGYASETWTTAQTHESKINATEITFLRKIEGKTRHHRIPNVNIRHSLKQERIGKFIERKKMARTFSKKGRKCNIKKDNRIIGNTEEEKSTSQEKMDTEDRRDWER